MSMSIEQIREILATEPAAFDKNLAEQLVKNSPHETIIYFMAITILHLEALKIQGIVPTKEMPLSHECQSYIGYFETAYRLHGVEREALNLDGWQLSYDPQKQETRAYFGLFGRKIWTEDSLYKKKFADYLCPGMLDPQFAISYLQNKTKDLAAEDRKLAEQQQELEQAKLISEAEEMTENFASMADKCHVNENNFATWQQQKSQKEPSAANSQLAADIVAMRENIAAMQQRSTEWHAKKNARRKAEETPSNSFTPR
jgi:hypothetical protein